MPSLPMEQRELTVTNATASDQECKRASVYDSCMEAKAHSTMYFYPSHVHQSRLSVIGVIRIPLLSQLVLSNDPGLHPLF